MRSASIFIFLFLFCLELPAQELPTRLWVSRRGDQYLRAQLVRRNESTLVLRDERGNLNEVDLADLSNEDRDFALSQKATLKPNSPPDSDSVTKQEAVANKIKKLPKVIRNLQRLLRAGKSTDEDGGRNALFGDDSSVYIELSGKFLNEFIQVPINQQQRVNERILGTPVDGNAQTTGVATIGLIPSREYASFEVIVSGQSDSLTTGRQPLINVHSDGTTWFEARKPLRIGTSGIELFKAQAKAKSTVNRSSVSTEIPGRVGRLVGRITARVVELQQPKIDSAASERAAYRAATDLDQRINGEVMRVQKVLTEIAPGLADGKPIVPIRFRTSSNKLGILIGEYEPPEWQDFETRTGLNAQDITVVLPKKTVATGKRLDMAMRLLSFSIEDQLKGIVDPKKLKPTRESWSSDKQWLTLEWDVDGTLVELLSKDFLAGTQAASAVVPSPPLGSRRQASSIFRPLSP